MKSSWLALLTLGVTIQVGLGLGCTALHRQKIPLVDDASRSDLAEIASSLEPGKRAIPRDFVFPKDARQKAIYGIDVSHYQGKVRWNDVLKYPIRFVFIKATQGDKYYDEGFRDNWNSLHSPQNKDARVRRGAYHFMTAVDDPVQQAQNFLSTIGPASLTDLPPCLDLEWDLLRSNGKNVLDKSGMPVDRWSGLSSSEILHRVTLWLETVKKATGRQPIVYTNLIWWKVRIGDYKALINYSLWVADYKSSSLGRESPLRPTGVEWRFWQFTDRGSFVDGSGDKIDVSIFDGSESEFEGFSPLGVK